MTSTDIAKRIAAAKRELKAKMDAAGLTQAAGWEILERVIDSDGGSTWLFVPAHVAITPPGDLSASVSVGPDGKVRD